MGYDRSWLRIDIAAGLTVVPSAAVATLSAATIAPFGEAGTDAFVSLTITLGIITGILLISGGVGHLGIISEFFSEPVLKGALGDLIEKPATVGTRFAVARAVAPVVASLEASGVDIPLWAI